MKESFPGYTRKSEVEIKDILSRGIIMFDTNVLLNLYRYSKGTREAFVDLMKRFEERLRLPHQAALEFNRRRCDVIISQEQVYIDFTKQIARIQKELQTSSRPPFLSKKTHDKLNSVLAAVGDEVTGSIDKYKNYLSNDPIYGQISRLFNGKITEGFTPSELSTIYEEGKDRYHKLIPPGYKDIQKPEPDRYGDLVLWKQVLAASRVTKKSVLLITDDKKEDWWWIAKGDRTLGPRQELVAELKKNSGRDLHIYTSEQFLTHAQAYLKEEVNKRALEEMQALQRAEYLKRVRKRKLKQEEAISRKSDRETFESLQYRYKEANARLVDLADRRKEAMSLGDGSTRFYEYLEQLDNLRTEIESELSHLRSALVDHQDHRMGPESDPPRNSNLDHYRTILKNNRPG